MKRNSLLLSCILILSLGACQASGNSSESTSSVLLDSSVISSVSQSSSQPEEKKEEPYDPSAITSIVERKIPYYSLSALPDGTREDGSTIYSVTATKFNTKRVYTVNHEDIPYLSFSDFVQSHAFMFGLTESAIHFEISLEGDVVKATNPTNQAYMEFNTLTRTVTYHGFELFFNLNSSADDKLNGALYGSKLLDDKKITYEYYPGLKTVSFSLADYSIKDYVYQGKVLLPYDTLCVLFNQASMTSMDSYAGNCFYGYSWASGDEKGVAANQYIRAQGTDWITRDYLLSSYNNLALAFDLHFGLDSHSSRVEKGKEITYMTKDAYSILEPYKERLLSTELNVSNDAMCELLSKEFDDGGHTRYSYTNFLSDKIITREEASGAETVNTLNTTTNIRSARAEKGTDSRTMFPDRIYSNGYYKEYGETAYIQFDSFTMLHTSKEDYQEMEISDTNYMSDSITLFHYANEKIQNNANIKNVVIDVSANGGGTVYAGEFISSWVCGGNEGTYRNVKTNDFLKYRLEADVNFDGSFNEKDYLSADKNLYVIISNGSFSCANKLSCNIQDNRKENTHFIGSRTGGGSCVIGNIPFTYLGGTIRISTNTQLGRLAATQDHFISNEDGVEADYLTIENSNASAFADVESIIDKINNPSNN